MPLHRPISASISEAACRHWHLVRWPLAFFVASWALIAATNADVRVAHELFFDAARGQWRGSDSWWANELIHTGGGWLMRGILLFVLCLWIAACLDAPVRHWRRPAAFVLVATLLTVGAIGLLKQFTNVDCPWDLQSFGGSFPYVQLFADRPDALRVARCFPAAHAGSGYALLALYFAALERSRRWAYAGLLSGLAMGIVFGIAQQSRGAHFLSHDLSSAMLAWLLSSGVYCLLFRCRLWAEGIPHAEPVMSVAASRMQSYGPGSNMQQIPLMLRASDGDIDLLDLESDPSSEWQRTSVVFGRDALAAPHRPEWAGVEPGRPPRERGAG